MQFSTRVCLIHFWCLKETCSRDIFAGRDNFDPFVYSGHFRWIHHDFYRERSLDYPLVYASRYNVSFKHQKCINVCNFRIHMCHKRAFKLLLRAHSVIGWYFYPISIKLKILVPLSKLTTESDLTSKCKFCFQVQTFSNWFHRLHRYRPKSSTGQSNPDIYTALWCSFCLKNIYL